MKVSNLFRDDMYVPYEATISEDKNKYEYAWFEAEGINILIEGWRDKFEILAQEKLAKLSQRNPKWQPYLVRRDHPFAYSGQSETFKPLQFGFKLEMRGATFFS
jgi:hypothetical protein